MKKLNWTLGLMMIVAFSWLESTSVSWAKPVAQTASVAQLAEGKKVFLANCALCHGKTGKADTAAGKAMHARNFTLGQFKYGDSFAAHLKVIQNGHGQMPAFKHLSQADLKDVVYYILSLKAH